MRLPSYAIVPSVWAWIFCACCLSPAAPEDLLAVGYRSPEQTLQTFQTALRSDLLGLEYKCLSEGFKRRHGVTELTWRLVREDMPWLKHAARAEIVEREDLPGGRKRLVARLDTLFVDETFAVDFVRHDFYETYDDEGLLEDDFASWREIARKEGDSLILEVPMPEGVAPHEITEFRAGQEWKIHSFERLTDAPTSPSSEPTP
jgi:hypothetical protein